MRTLHIDFETYSECDIKKVGAWAYSCHPSTEVLMMAWAFDDEEPKIWLPGESTIQKLWVDKWGKETFELHAFNDFFEYSVMKNVLNLIVPERFTWHDTAAEAAALALPRGLGDCCEALGLPQDKAKDKEGKALITMFSKPRKSTKKGGTTLIRTRPEDNPEKFELFKEYCKQDVVAEREVRKRMRPLSVASRSLWELDRKINLRGVRFDMESVKNAIAIRQTATEKLMNDARVMTLGELTNINSRNQLIEYLATLGVSLENTQKEYLKTFLEEHGDEIDPEAKQLIEIRLKIAKSSLAKYDKLTEITVDNKAYGLLRWHGATTGRWSGNLFQPQNLPRPSFKDTDDCISLFHYKDPGIIEALFCDPLEALSSCLRGMIIPSEGHRLVVSDFSQIESRVLRWLAGASLEVYIKKLDVYKMNAVDTFKVKYDEVDSFQRLIGKVIELACGYQGAVGAFQQFADVYGVKIPDAEAKEFVGKWRLANPKICSYWTNVEATAVKAVGTPGTVQKLGNIAFKCVGTGRRRFLLCKLPSGREIAYHRPTLFESKFGKQQIKFWGVDSKTKKYCEQRTYGGKLVENITQAVACDLMGGRMLALEEAGYPIVLTVHDEIITDTPKGHGSIEEFNKIMKQTPPWAKGLPIDAEGYTARRYRK